MTVSMQARAALFNRAYRQSPAAAVRVAFEQGRAVAYGTWVLGNDYRVRSTLYGAFPHGFLPRLMALFPETPPARVLHVFSGSLRAGRYVRLDLLRRSVRPELVGSVYDVRRLWDGLPFRLIIADPPYSLADAAQYGTPTVNRLRATTALAGVASEGGHMAWLDTCWPQHRKALWETVGRITVVRSTNHRVRLLSLFERTGARA